jgi:hypothetical protein
MYACSKLKHENVMRVLGLALFRDSLAIVYPWMENGTVVDYIGKNPGVDRCKMVRKLII